MSSDEDILECLGYGIAFGYYLYLKDGPFLKLTERRASFEDCYEIRLDPKFKEILILIPDEKSYCDIKIFEELKVLNNLITITNDSVGIKDRPYKLTVYNLLETERHFIIEMTQCLDCLHQIKIRKLLNKEQKTFVINQFINILCYLLKKDKACEGMYQLLRFSEGDKFVDVLNRTVTTSKVEKLQTENLGKGLANWFYYNYLLLIKQKLPSQMERWEEDERNRTNVKSDKTKVRVELIKKVHLLVPNSCFCPPDIKNIIDVDECIEYAQDLNSNTPLITVGANYEREYKNCVLCVECKEPKEKRVIFCIAEFASPIRQIYRMYDQHRNKMMDIEETSTEMNEQREKFELELKELLKTESLYEVIPYIDLENTKISSVLLQRIK